MDFIFLFVLEKFAYFRGNLILEVLPIFSSTPRATVYFRGTTYFRGISYFS